MSQREQSRQDGLIDPRLLQTLGNMRIRARTVVEGAIAGLHRSALKGGSIEFTEYKEYSPGDEIRHIDWRTFARSDRYYVKQFEEETNLRAYLMLDVSGSMSYGFEDNLPKLTYASYLAAALAYLLVRQGDAVGLLTFDDAPRVFLPASSKQSHLDDLYKVLENGATHGKTKLASAMATMAERGKRRSVVFLISDLLDTAPEALNMAKVLRRRLFEVNVFHIVDPAELNLPFEGLTIFEGLEDDGELLVDPDDIREQYIAEMDKHISSIERTCSQDNIDYVRVPTTTPIGSVLLEFLFRRGGRR